MLVTSIFFFPQKVSCSGLLKVGIGIYFKFGLIVVYEIGGTHAKCLDNPDWFFAVWYWSTLSTKASCVIINKEKIQYWR